MVNTNILLLHTVGEIAQGAVAFILVRAVYLLSRNGEAPRGFVPIAALMVAASFARGVRLICSWFAPPPPTWLDDVTLLTIFFATMAIPIILSVHYLPIPESPNSRTRKNVWLQWAMIVNAGLGTPLLSTALFVGARDLVLLVAAVMCTLSAILLRLRASLFRNLQLRRKGLLLFSGLTTVGLLGISVNLFHRYLGKFFFLGMPGLNAAIEVFNMLITLGMMFVFASLRLADVIVKRVVGIYIWCIVSLMTWGIVQAFTALASSRPDQEATFAFLAVVVIATALWITPQAIRISNEWIDRWVFEVPDFNLAIQSLWERLLELENEEDVYQAGSETISDVLSVAAVKIVAPSDVQRLQAAIPFTGPNPYFIHANSPLRSILSPAADVLVPLIREGVADHWIVLSNGALRPPLTAMELSFVVRIAGEMQVRNSAILAEQRRLERLRRESTFREEIAEAELRALRAQINPHFLFNSLNTIADLSVVAPQKAEEMTLRLSAVFRYVLSNTDRQFTSVAEELDFVRSYLDIEEARFEDRLKVRFDVEPEVLSEKVPTLLLQPLIENALKHGLSPKRNGGTLSIQARRTASGFELIVSDDGVGLGASPNRGTTDRNTHVGLKNVAKRLQTAYAGRAELTLRPREGGGTEVSVLIGRDSKDKA